MSREQMLAFGMAGATVIALVLAAIGFSRAGIDWGGRVIARGLELYYGELARLTEELEKSRAQEQRGAGIQADVEQAYDRLTDKYLELQRAFNEQGERLKRLERYHQEEGRT